MFQSYLIKPEPKLAQLYTVFTVFSIMPARDVPNCRKYFRKQICSCGSPSYWIRYEISKCQNLENEWKYTEKKEVMLWSGGWSQLSVLSLTATENFQVVSFKAKANYFRCSSGKPDSVISCHDVKHLERVESALCEWESAGSHGENDWALKVCLHWKLTGKAHWGDRPSHSNFIS